MHFFVFFGSFGFLGEKLRAGGGFARGEASSAGKLRNWDKAVCLAYCYTMNGNIL